MSNLAVQPAHQPQVISGWRVEVLDDILCRASEGGAVAIEISGLCELHTFDGQSLVRRYDREEAERRRKTERKPKLLDPDAFGRIDINFGGRLSGTRELCEGSLTNAHFKDDVALLRRGIIGECRLDVVRRSQFVPNDVPLFT
ncbi:hypothetical protein, partial [Nitrobacter sp.]|uniref:hypothetical protein n=1 Tax=Nitrobacter sp. TaxID=29420 RepID=UPI0029CAAF68